MLYFDIILALLMLLVANLGGWGIRGFWGLFGLMSPVYIFFGLVGFWPLGLLTLFLIMLFIVQKATGMRFARFAAGSLVASLGAFAIPLVYVLQMERELADVRLKYPLVDLTKILPEPKPNPVKYHLAAGTMQHLEELSNSTTDDGFGSFEHLKEGRWASRTLQRIHSTTVQDFVNRPGFGVARGSSRPDPDAMARFRKEDISITQPGQSFVSSAEPQELPGNPDSPAQTGLLSMHRKGIENFANPAGFGFIKDRQQVAMLEKHRFQAMPKVAPGFELRRVELMGLLLKPDPVVYESANLPRMEELGKVPTRALDSFEKRALEQLQSGRDLLAGSTPEGLRMVGAIRSAKTCTKCHGGEVGDLLGAFSYVLGNTVVSK